MIKCMCNCNRTAVAYNGKVTISKVLKVLNCINVTSSVGVVEYGIQGEQTFSNVFQTCSKNFSNIFGLE